MSADPVLSLAQRQRLIPNAPLGAQSWFRCGGHADYLFRPDSIEDLQEFLSNTPVDGPVTILGGLANTIIRDGGIRGVVIQPDKALARIQVLNDTDIYAEAGALNGSVAAAAVKAGIGGLEFLSGIPGKVGGALRMNAGAYGAEMKDVLVEASAISAIHHQSPRLRAAVGPALLELNPKDLKMSYRHTNLPEGTILTSCILRGMKEDYQTVKNRMNEIKARRNETQPIREKTGGSTFANPLREELEKAGLPEGTRAWQIVEEVGGRGLKIGGAQMSEKHCNFMINTGNATATDLENLGDELRRRAQEDLSLNLRWEINRIGEKEALKETV